MSQTVSRITAESLAAQQVTMASANDVVQLLVELYLQGVQSEAVPVLVNGTPDWQITIRQPGFVDQIANLNDWIVTGFNGPLGPLVLVYPNYTFLSAMTANLAMSWSATTTAPVATAETGAAATVVAPWPSSPNGPWTFTCALTNLTTNAALTTETVGAPTSANGQVSFPLSGLVVGDKYSATITVSCTNYAGVSATSVASNTITATA